MADPTPPSDPPLGSSWGNVPPPPAGPADPPRISTGGSTGSRRSSRTGYPPAVGLARPSSTGSLREAEAARDGGASPAGIAEAAALIRSSSSGSLRRPGSGGAQAARNPSREQLEPLPPGSPLVPPVPDHSTTPRDRASSIPRLAPLQPAGTTGGATGSGSGSGRRGNGVVPPLAPLNGSGSPATGSGRSGSGRGSGRAVPLLDLAGAGAAGSADAEGGAAGPAAGAAAVPPPPAPPLGAGGSAGSAAARRLAQSSDAPNAPTARGPVKWVPHTHANPKHAKFCFICLHGKLEGQGDEVDREVQRQKQEEEDLPSPVDMKELAYLAGDTQSFRRCNADFERDNITACWLRGVQDRVYNEVIKGMVAEQNSDISLGVDVRLTNHEEDEKDREVLRKLFTFSDEEEAAVEEKLQKLGEWCTEQEVRLVDVNPDPVERPPLPEVPDPTPEQLELLEYQPLVDLSALTGETAADAREAMRAADAAIGNSRDKKEFQGFKVTDLPPPRTYPDMPEAEVVPYPLTIADVPPYEPMQPPKPVPFPIEACIDPFERPFLFLPEFQEKTMPEFEDTTSFAEPRCPAPEAAKEEWLATTRSIFPENNPPDETSGWGWIPERKRLVVPLLDEPYLPPYDVVGDEDGGKKLMMRGLWDAELFTTEGKMVPPLKERGKELYQAPKIEHPDEPLWSSNLAPPKTREEKIKDLIDIIPVKSFVRFKPKKVDVELPDFLWNLAREDAAGQGLWDVIAQRHEIPREVRRQREEENEKLQKARAAEEEAVNATLMAEQEHEAAHARAESEASDPDPNMQGSDLTMSPELDTSGMGVRPPQTPVVMEQVEGMPDLEVEVPAPPAPSAHPPQPLSHEGNEVALNGPPSPQAAAGMNASRQQALQAHQQRVQELVQRGGEGRKVQELLSDDRFLDSLAEKISNRLGGGGTGLLSPSATQGAWAPTGEQSGSGRPTGQILRPEPPSFAEPLDEESRATLPPALLGNNAASKTGTVKSKEIHTTINDVNAFTQEKMRGDCYVRLLLQPEPNAARKDPVPYVGEVMTPDHSLVADTGRPHTRVPPKPRKVREDGEFEDEDDEDEYADFERNDTVVFSFVRHNRYEAVQALIEQESETLEARDEAGNNLLHVACQNDARRIVKLLLKNGVSVNEQNNRGNTPLHYCNQYGFTQLAAFLVAHGAEESIPNHQGLLPAQGLGRTEDAIAQAQRQLQADRARGPGGL